jgi:protein required for attachment to host cells
MSNSQQPTVWVLVADGERARVLAPEATERRFATVLSLGVAEHPHYAPGLQVEAHHVDKLHYGIEVARSLNYAAEHDRYDQLVLVAPGHILHAVREALSKLAAARVVGTMSKDLTKLNDHEISAHIAEWWIAPQVGAEA